MTRNLFASAIVAMTLPLVAWVAPASAEYPDNPSGEVAGITGERGAEVQGVAATKADPAEVRGTTLGVTGSDVAGLTLLGAGLTGAGVVLLRRSRRIPIPATV